MSTEETEHIDEEYNRLEKELQHLHMEELNLQTQISRVDSNDIHETQCQELGDEIESEIFEFQQTGEFF